jgi:hypothetical protein
VDWWVKSTLSETLEVNDNRQMRVNPLGMSYNPSTWLVVDATARTPTSRLDLNGFLRYKVYAGPGEQGIANALDRGVSGRFEKWQALTAYHLLGSHTEFDTSSIQQQETGFVTPSGSTTITDTVGGGLRHEFGPRDSAYWQTTWTTTSTTSSSAGQGTPLVNQGLGTPIINQGQGTPINNQAVDNLTSLATWTHQVSPITRLIPYLQFQHLTYHNAEASEVMFWTAKTSLETELTSRLRFYAEAGAALLNSTNNGLGSNNATVAAAGSLLLETGAIVTQAPPAGSSIDWIGSARLVYTLKTIELALAVARTIGPTTFGTFLKNEEIRFSARYLINNASSVLLSGAFNHQTPGTGSPTDRIVATVAYDRTLAREWRGQLAYVFNQNITTVGTTRSNALYATLTREFTILP